jgi:hypothetical protein
MEFDYKQAVTCSATLAEKSCPREAAHEGLLATYEWFEMLEFLRSYVVFVHYRNLLRRHVRVALFLSRKTTMTHSKFINIFVYI